VRPVLLVHGGAGRVPEDGGKAAREGLEAAASAAWRLLDGGSPALEAVVAAVQAMEEDPRFNAGYGSVLTEDGDVEMDAAVMDGSTLRAGGVAAVRSVRNPVLLARAVLEEGRHVLLVGEGAERLAAARGVPRCRPGELITPARQAQWERGRAERAGGTVDAVALDAAGRLAAATSTGGIAGKRAGRVGDSPLIGCGTYADARGAASATGDGEAIIRAVLAARAVDALEKASEPAAVARAALARMQVLTGGTGGLILLDATGRAGLAHTTPFMAMARRGGAA
jgi:beta-aspartyl-peptidase (threonine type)